MNCVYKKSEYIEYFNPEASPGNMMPSCVLPKYIIVGAKKLKIAYYIILRHSMYINHNDW